ncbi:MAG: transcriptional repressor [Bacteroidales bacterium]|nr:transcriptional repressor [Bacteroidales bacterium]
MPHCITPSNCCSIQPGIPSISFGNNCAKFEKSFKFKQHDHVICLDDGKVLGFCDPRVQQIQDAVEEQLGVKITHHSLTFYGVCNNNGEEKNKK